MSSEALIKGLRIKWQQGAKDNFTAVRDYCLNVYDGLTASYVEKYYSTNALEQVIPANNNITQRVINRTSLVYMVQPIRNLDAGDSDKPHPKQGDYDALTAGKRGKMSRAERWTNLLNLTILHARWDKTAERVRYQVINDFEPEFNHPDDPLRLTGISYPLATPDTVRDVSERKWMHWDENTFCYYVQGDGAQKASTPEEHGLGLLPFVPVFRDGVPETGFMDVAPSLDLVDMNLLLNILLTDAEMNQRYQGHGIIWGSGIPEDKRLLVDPRSINAFTDPESKLNCLTLPNTAESSVKLQQYIYKSTAQNYGLDPSFVEGTTAESGVALRIRNQELTDNRRGDVDLWRDVENELYTIERSIIKAHKGIDLPETMSVDFSESTEVLTPEQQQARDEWNLAHGLTSEALIAMRENPDRWEDEDAAAEWVANNKKVNRSKGGSLMDRLNKPVEANA